MKLYLELTSAEFTTLTNALQVAAERFDEHVKTFAELARDEQPERGFITQEGARRLGKQFQQQADDSRAMLDRLYEAEEA